VASEVPHVPVDDDLDEAAAPPPRAQARVQPALRLRLYPLRLEGLLFYFRTTSAAYPEGFPPQNRQSIVDYY